MDPIEKIIDRLEKEHVKNGMWYMLQYWYTKDFSNPNIRQMTYYKIYGFLSGLLANEYIEKSEYDEATDYIYEKITKYA